MDPTQTADEGWEAIRGMAKSMRSVDRMVALARACGNLERALAAHGMQKRQPLAVAIRSWPHNEGIWLDRSLLLNAVEARNYAVHEGTAPSQPKCRYFVHEIHKAWMDLRMRFVTQENAARIAGSMLERTDLVRNVLLFGSLSRASKSPADIDLLMEDEGELSSVIIGYHGRGGITAVEALDECSLLSDSERAAVGSGWLDFVILNERLFAEHIEYRTKVMESQRDPFFFLNIASDLLVFREGEWLKEDRPAFSHLAELREQLSREGIRSRHPQETTKLTRFLSCDDVESILQDLEEERQREDEKSAFGYDSRHLLRKTRS